MTEINVFLDDYRPCPDGYVLAENIDECISLLTHYSVDYLSLDHDLENKDRNGLMLVHYMVEHQLYAKHITIHSANASGGKAMFNYLKQAQKDHLMPNELTVTLYPLPLRGR